MYFVPKDRMFQFGENDSWWGIYLEDADLREDAEGVWLCDDDVSAGRKKLSAEIVRYLRTMERIGIEGCIVSGADPADDPYIGAIVGGKPYRLRAEYAANERAWRAKWQEAA
jgi:hypothetical protein